MSDQPRFPVSTPPPGIPLEEWTVREIRSTACTLVGEAWAILEDAEKLFGYADQLEQLLKRPEAT